MIRKVLIGLILLLILIVIVGVVGLLGLGKRINAPGLDALVSRMVGEDRQGRGSSPDTTLPWNIGEIAGTWSGASDVDGTTWQFTFEKNFAVRVASSSGYSNQGTAFVHWKLGLTDGFLRVPPGWSPLDVDIIDSTEQLHRNASSLGAFSLRGKILKYCFGEPGKLVRPHNDISREGIRCFDLSRADTGSNAVSSGKAKASSAPLLPEAPASGMELHGSAEIIIDGTTERWPLRIDQEAATDLSDLHRATLQFQAHGTKFPEARRIEITLDAARAGRHRADGSMYTEGLFIREHVPVGSASVGGEPEAVVIFIADGGQIFPPRSHCSIIVLTPFSDKAAGIFEGRLEGCEVYSAGVVHTISSMSFSVRRGEN